MKPLVVGIDGGGTKTLLAAADSSGQVVLIERAAGVAPIETPGWEALLQVLLSRLGQAASSVAFAVFALPVYGEMPRISRRQEEVAALIAPFPHLVMNDVHAAFEGAFTGDAGVLLLAGTGSMVWAQDAAHARVRVGGWGHGFGDEGSAFSIGREAVSILSHCLDGRHEDRAFEEAIALFLGLSTMDRNAALLDWFYRDADMRMRVASLAREVDRLAEAGNDTARKLLSDAADRLAAHVRTAWRCLPSLPRAVWRCSGGVMESRLVVRGVSEALGMPPSETQLPPIGGALWRAAVEAGWRPDGEWIRRLRDDLAVHLPTGSSQHEAFHRRSSEEGPS